MVQRHADAHHRPEVVGPEREPGHHAEVAAPATQRPEQVGVLLGRGRHHLAAGEHDLQFDELVAGKSVFAREPADATAERQARHAGLRHDPGRHDHRVRGGRRIDVAEQAPSADMDEPLRCVDRDLTQPAEVDRQPALGHGLARDVMPTAAHSGGKAVGARHIDCGDNVGGTRAPQDEARLLVDHAVPDESGLCVLRMVGADDRTLEPSGQLLGDPQPLCLVDFGRGRDGGHVVSPSMRDGPYRCEQVRGHGQWAWSYPHRVRRWVGRWWMIWLACFQRYTNCIQFGDDVKTCRRLRARVCIRSWPTTSPPAEPGHA